MLWIELWNVLFGNAFICLRRLNVNKLQQCESFLRSYKESHDYFIKQKTEFTKVLSSIINYIYKNTHKRSEFDDILYFLP